MPKLSDKALTAMAVEKLKPQSKRYAAYDAALRGFGVRVAPSGVKTWFVMKRVGGRMVRGTVGRFPEMSLRDARLKAEEMLGEMAAGDLPRNGVTPRFQDVLDQWLERDQGENRSLRTVENAMRNHALPRLRGKQIDAVRKTDIIRILDSLIDAGATIQANRVLSYLRRLFNWCLERDLVTANPAAGIKPPTREHAADRVLSQTELRAVWEAAGQMGFPFGPFTQILILTGQRRDEVASMTWSEVDLDGAVWTIPGQRTKNGRPHVVHLSAAAREIIDTIPRLDGTALLFTTNGKRSISGFSKGKKRLDDLCGVRDWTYHDIRRTFATRLTESMGFTPVVVDRILNHVEGSVKGVAAVYQRGKYLEERKLALERWGEFILEQSGRDLEAASK